MTNFLSESTVSLISLLVFYHLFLEREKMHQFNRFYLLFSIIISLVIPFISIEIIQEIENIPLATNFPIFILFRNANLLVFSLFQAIKKIFICFFCKISLIKRSANNTKTKPHQGNPNIIIFIFYFLKVHFQ